MLGRRLWFGSNKKMWTISSPFYRRFRQHSVLANWSTDFHSFGQFPEAPANILPANGS